MCLDPASMAAMSTVMQVIGVGTTIMAQKQSADATTNSYNYQAKVNEVNAENSANQAKDAVERGYQAETDLRRKAAGAKSTQKTLFGSQGSDISSGSPLDILSDTAYQSELDASTIRYNSQLEKYDLLNQGQNSLNEASMNRYAAANAQTAGKWNMASTLLTGASQVSGKYAQFKKDYPTSKFFG